jgi:hypothetical protein
MVGFAVARAGCQDVVAVSRKGWLSLLEFTLERVPAKTLCSNNCGQPSFLSSSNYFLTVFFVVVLALIIFGAAGAEIFEIVLLVVLPVIFTAGFAITGAAFLARVVEVATAMGFFPTAILGLLMATVLVDIGAATAIAVFVAAFVAVTVLLVRFLAIRDSPNP